MKPPRIHLYGTRLSDRQVRLALRTRAVPVAVYGLGKIGLPLAAVYADRTGNVTGVDLDQAVVARVNAGESPVAGEPGLDELVAETVADGRLEATTEGETAADRATVHVVVVPTLVADGDPDLSALDAVLDTVAAGLDPGDVVFVESTLPPGTCREVVEPTLATRSDHPADSFGVAFCPERTASGRAVEDITGAYPKVVGGTDGEAGAVAARVYDLLTDNEVLEVSDATTAEAVKVFEGVYRDVNIALANELARIRGDLGVDAVEAIEAANTQPYCDIHDPGAGVGGHCIPYYPYFVMARTDAETPLLRTAREVNDGMPGFTVDVLASELDAAGVDVADASVAVLGITYRPGVNETRATPAAPIVDSLSRLGATVYGVDPLVDDVASFGAEPLAVDEFGSVPLDAAVLVTPHREFEAIDWEALDPLVVVDGRDALDLAGTDHRVYTIGRGRVSGRVREGASAE